MSGSAKRLPNDLLGSRPIDGQTLLIAKGASLFAFALVLGFAMNLPALFFASRIPSLGRAFPAVHLGATALLALFVTSTVVFAYGLVIRFVGRDRFDSVAAWSQAALSGAFLDQIALKLANGERPARARVRPAGPNGLPGRDLHGLA